MDDEERDEILIRVDERTKRIDEHLTDLEKDINEVENDMADVRKNTMRNSTDIKTGKGILAGLATITSALLAKVVGLLQL